MPARLRVDGRRRATTLDESAPSIKLRHCRAVDVRERRDAVTDRTGKIPRAKMMSGVRKRSIYFRGQKTSVSLEDEFWSALHEISAANGERVPDTLKAIDRGRPDGLNLSSAIRLFVLRHFRNATSPPTP
jgi:predicted DNA-binding ribbon-helix-helix protein